MIVTEEVSVKEGDQHLIKKVFHEFRAGELISGPWVRVLTDPQAVVTSV